MLQIEDIRKLTPGRKTDILVARTLGWAGVRKANGRWMGCPPSDPMAEYEVPDFSKSVAPAFRLLDHHYAMAAKLPVQDAAEPMLFEMQWFGGGKVAIMLVWYHHDGPMEQFRVPDDPADHADTGMPFPIAACQAFLLAWLDRTPNEAELPVPAETPAAAVDEPLPTVGDYEP